MNPDPVTQVLGLLTLLLLAAGMVVVLLWLVRPDLARTSASRSHSDRARIAYLAILALAILSFGLRTWLIDGPGSPDYLATPAPVTPAPPSTTPPPTPTSAHTPTRIDRYGTKRFNNIENRWVISASDVAQFSNVPALESHIVGCGSQTMSQVRYWGLDSTEKELQFSIGQGNSSAKQDQVMRIKVQARDASSTPWGDPVRYDVRFGEVRVLKTEVGGAAEILVTVYADEPTCALADFSAVYFDDQILYYS